MYFYSKKSSNKIIHIDPCFHIRRLDAADIGWFSSLPEAYEQGYRLCKCCNPLVRQYRVECAEILEYCRKNGLSVFLTNRYISIHSIGSIWRIALDQTNDLVLYHRNDFETDNDHLSQIKGYHLQRDVRRNSIMEYLDYIVDHDYFRMLHPVHIPKKKGEAPPPRKGTKRYKSAQRKIKRDERVQAIKNVLDLIDSLSIPSSPVLATTI